MAHASRTGCKTFAQFQSRQKIGRQIGLQDQIVLVGWATPTARDHKDGRKSNVPINGLLGRQVWMVTPHGKPRTGSDARIINGDRLNPDFARWLMGYPPAWGNCAPTAMPSSRKSQPLSSRPSRKAA